MSGTRALFASIGASVSLVVAAALSLLAVSAVFAFGGWSDPVAESARQTALILADGGTGQSQTIKRKELVLPPRAHPARQSQPAIRVNPVRSQSRARAAGQAVITRSNASRPPKASLPATTVEPELPATPAPAIAARKTTGDRVRTGGDDISGKVQNAGEALAQVTAPLLPPVSAATQKILNVVAELLRRTTNGLAGALDNLHGKR